MKFIKSLLRPLICLYEQESSIHACFILKPLKCLPFNRHHHYYFHFVTTYRILHKLSVLFFCLFFTLPFSIYTQERHNIAIYRYVYLLNKIQLSIDSFVSSYFLTIIRTTKKEEKLLTSYDFTSSVKID